jgi:putative inorganic carbon (hco3(-)) transporter
MTHRLGGAWLAIPAAVLAAAVAATSAIAPLAALAAIGGMAMLALVFANATALLFVLVAAFPWDDALAFPTDTVSVVKILGALVLVGYLIRLLAANEPIFLPAPLGWLAALTLWVLLATLVSPDISDSIAKTLRYVLFASFFFLYVQLVRTRAAVRASLRVLLLSLSGASVVALVMFLTQGYGLASGPVGDPNDFGYLLASSLPLAGFLIVDDRRYRGFWVLATIPIVTALLATLSRGALVGVLALVAWAVLTRRVPLGGILAGAAAALVILVLAFTFWRPLIDERVQAKGTVANANVQSREALWRGAFRMAADRPLTGVGPGRYGIASPAYVTDEVLVLEEPVVHNSYLEVLAELGLPALIAFLGFLAAAWRCARIGIARSRETGDREGVRMGVAVQAALVVALVSGMFISAQVIVPMWLLAALATVVASTRPADARP